MFWRLTLQLYLFHSKNAENSPIQNYIMASILSYFTKFEIGMNRIVSSNIQIYMKLKWNIFGFTVSNKLKAIEKKIKETINNNQNVVNLLAQWPTHNRFEEWPTRTKKLYQITFHYKSFQTFDVQFSIKRNRL